MLIASIIVDIPDLSNKNKKKPEVEKVEEIIGPVMPEDDGSAPDSRMEWVLVFYNSSPYPDSPPHPDSLLVCLYVADQFQLWIGYH